MASLSLSGAPPSRSDRVLGRAGMGRAGQSRRGHQGLLWKALLRWLSLLLSSDSDSQLADLPHSPPTLPCRPTWPLRPACATWRR